ncbi:nuclease-related domain-containing protein [Priestia abyssalis]|uniref:nuclease-related domain-containing protein n=1 Tax=Priestia abyssalis TaxID=1221450 RepID=UPI000995C86E|nr:nuclease-related domain-containing protein [Priestia abyssalis]
MIQIVIIVVLAIALAGTGYIIYRQAKTLGLQKQVMLQRHELEIAAAVEEFEEKQAAIEEHHQHELWNLQEHHAHEKSILNESIHQLNEYIYELQSYSRNIGEVKTHQLLHEIKKRWMEQEILTDSTMLIVPNVFIPFSSEYGMKTRKIDHIVLLPTGIYIVQTKYWKGKIVHGLTKKNAGKFSFLLDLINAKSYVEASEQTFSFVSQHSTDEDDSFTPVIQVKAHGELTKQINKTTEILFEFLNNKVETTLDFITPVLYFGYQHNDYKTNGVMDLSENEQVIRLSSDKELSTFLEEERQKPVIYSERDLQEIQFILEHIDYAAASLPLYNRTVVDKNLQ